MTQAVRKYGYEVKEAVREAQLIIVLLVPCRDDALIYTKMFQI